MNSHSFKKILLISLCIIIISIVGLGAHPHMMFYPNLTIKIEENTCTEIQMNWEFDTMFSMSIIDGFDKNQNRIFEQYEIDSIYDHAFLNLENYHYFITIQKGNKNFFPDNISEFTAIQNSGKLSYQFTISLLSYDLNQDFSLTIFDPTFFCAVSFLENPVDIVKTNSTTDPAFTLKKNKKKPFYYDPQGAVDDTTVYHTWKPGLKSAYPEVIYVEL